MKKIFLLIIYGVIIKANAQTDFREGYLIRANGDSVNGVVAYQNESSSSLLCSFKKDKESHAETFHPGEIRAYGFPGDKRFESMDLPADSGKTVLGFAQVIVRGQMSLYRFQRRFYVDKDGLVYLPVKHTSKVYKGNEVFEKTTYPHIAILNTLVADCGLSANNVRYEELDLTKLVKKYNDCKGAPSLVYKDKSPWTKVDINVFAALDISKIKIDEAPLADFNNSYSMLYGVGFDFSAPRINEKIGITVEVMYIKKIYQAYAAVEQSTTMHYDYIAKASFLKLPLGVKYNFLHAAATPYIKGGIAPYIMMKSSFLTIAEEEAQTVVYTTFLESPEPRTQLAYWAAVGFSYAISQRHKLVAEFRHERGNGPYNAPFESSSVNNNILIGIRF